MLSRVGAVCAILVSLNNSTALRGIQNSSLWKIASLSWNYMFHDKICRYYECCHSLILSCHCHQCHDVSFSSCYGLSPVHIATKLLSLILFIGCLTPGNGVWLLVKLRDLNSNALIWYISVLLNFFWECCSTLARGSLHNSGRRWGINQTWATNTCSSFSVINRSFSCHIRKGQIPWIFLCLLLPLLLFGQRSIFL